jgi:hypothetical protein
MPAAFSYKEQEMTLRSKCFCVTIKSGQLNTNNPKVKRNPMSVILDYTYVTEKKKPRKVETIPIEGGRFIKGSADGMAAARKAANENTK